MPVRLAGDSQARLEGLCVKREFERARRLQTFFRVCDLAIRAGESALADSITRISTRSPDLRSTRLQFMCCFVSVLRPLTKRSNVRRGLGPGSITSTWVTMALRIHLLLMPAVHSRAPFRLTSKHIIIHPFQVFPQLPFDLQEHGYFFGHTLFPAIKRQIIRLCRLSQLVNVLVAVNIELIRRGCTSAYG
jgi:hypothetical protein